MEVIQTLIGVAIGSLIALLIAIWTMRKSSRALRTETAAVLAASETARQEHRDFLSSYYLETPLMFAGIIMISLGGIVFFASVAWMEQRLVHW